MYEDRRPAPGDRSDGVAPRARPVSARPALPLSARPALPLSARPALRLVVLAGALALLVACGGGGGPAGPQFPVTPPAEVLDGLSGTVSLPDLDLGRIIEQEPNDTTAQPFQIAPVWPGSTFEVTGLLGTSDVHYGRTDLYDVLRVTSIEDQHVSLTVTYTGIDPVSSNPNELGVAIRLAGDGNDIVVVPPAAQPVALTFDAIAGTAYDVHLTLASGHAAYVARFELDAPASSPKPRTSRTAPTAAVAPPMTAVASASRVLTPAPGEPACAATHLLVRLEEGCDAAAFCERRGLRIGRRLATGSYCMAFDTAAGASGRHAAVSLCETLASDADVQWAEPDWIVRPLGVPDDTAFNRQWNMRAIGAPSAWDLGPGDPSIVVGVIDSGIIDHPDMAGQTVAGYDFISDPAVSVDGGGRDPDPTDPGDGFDGSGLSTWHGTHVSGIIAARRGDAYGVGGLASGCRILPARALGVGGGFVSDAVDALLWIAGLHTTGDGRRLAPLRIANLSLGLTQDSSDLREACDRAANQGVFIVAAAGNTGSAVLYPARYDSVFAVAAVDGNLETTQYSSYGDEVDIAAPGGLLTFDHWADGWMDGVLSCVQDETVNPFRKSHQYLVGTSQSAPHVAAAAALMLSIDPTLSTADLASILRATALDLGSPGDDIAYGAGLLQAHKALATVLNRLGTPRSDAAYLMLPTTSVQFDGFRLRRTLPLFNGGGGQLQLFIARPETDDGVPWLVPTLQQSGAINPPVNLDELQIEIDRNQLPTTPGRYSGTVRIADATRTVAAIRVVVFVSERTRVGIHFPVVAHQRDTGIARRKGFAIPERNYRYFLRGLPTSSYLLQGGEDLDLDGFFCEPFEACGWHGGPTEQDAVSVAFVPGTAPVRGLSIQLIPPP